MEYSKQPVQDKSLALAGFSRVWQKQRKTNSNSEKKKPKQPKSKLTSIQKV